jgi:predicted nucleic acid-binding protein
LNKKIEAIEKAYAPLLARGEAIWNIRKNIDFDDLSSAHSPEEIKEALSLAIEEFLHEGNRKEELEEKLKLLGVDEKVDEEIGSFL